ncbi:MAG: class I SAM-dependent methyltransferase [Ignavibacteriae bacterium]|nr:class I SAM-dependent methyltransferase [Ignavibacteriota bacterium]
MGWSSRASQEKRFEVLTSLMSKEYTSVLDVGSGYGDFTNFIAPQRNNKIYVGIEPFYDFYKLACNTYGTKYFVNESLDGFVKQYSQLFDYVIASGLFWRNQDRWEEFFMKTIQTMFSICEIGVCANLLSSNHPKQKPWLIYVNPTKVVPKLKTITPNVKIVENYFENNRDFTFLLEK